MKFQKLLFLLFLIGLINFCLFQKAIASHDESEINSLSFFGKFLAKIKSGLNKGLETLSNLKTSFSKIKFLFKAKEFQPALVAEPIQKEKEEKEIKIEKPVEEKLEIEKKPEVLIEPKIQKPKPELGEELPRTETPVPEAQKELSEPEIPAGPEKVPAWISLIPLPTGPSGLPVPGAGGGSPASSVNSDNSASQGESGISASAPEEESSETEDSIAPEPPVIVSPTNFQTFTTSLIAFSGAAEASSTISQDFSQATTTVNSEGNWSLVLDLIQSTSTINFYASDSAGNISSSTSIELFVDSVSPIIDNFYISQCLADNLLSGDDGVCLLATTTLNFTWLSESQDIDYYEIFFGSNISTTTATSAVLSLSDNASYIFSLRARDKIGNWSASSTAEAEISTVPVVINEVAWMGTATSSYDEWIELYNNTSKTINLENWVLYSETDNTPYINLASSTPGQGYFLLERTDDDTISDIAADQIYTGALSNSGEILKLVKVRELADGNATTTIDQTILTEGSVGDWPTGNNTDKTTMERINSLAPGNDIVNWGTNNGLIINGEDAGQNPIKGTPKAKNSLSL